MDIFHGTAKGEKSNIHTKQKSIEKIGISMKEIFMICTIG